MTGKTLTIKNPSSKLLELIRILKEEQEKRILELKEKYKDEKQNR